MSAPSCSKSCACTDERETVGEAPAGLTDGSVRSVFHLKGMDCPAEEQQVRQRLVGYASHLSFDLPARRVTVWHEAEAEALLARLLPLGFGGVLEHSERSSEAPPAVVDEAAERRSLRTLLAINALMFVIEVGAGWWAASAGLLADGLDMLADAAVYGIALFAVGGSAARKHSAARAAGLLQLLLALGLLFEVGRRLMFGAEPLGGVMMVVACVALVANVSCLALIARHRDGGVHMRASYIFSANDVLANLGVIAAGALVGWSGQAWPDWLIGGVIAVIVLLGAIRILRLRQT